VWYCSCHSNTTLQYLHTTYSYVDAKLLTAVFISMDFGYNFQTYLTQKHCTFMLVNSLQCHVTTDTKKFDFYQF